MAKSNYISPSTLVLAAQSGGDGGATVSQAYNPGGDTGNLSKRNSDFEDWQPVAGQKSLWDD